MGDYDREQMKLPSDFLKLASKDEEATFRIVSSPYRELKVWPNTEERSKPLPATDIKDLTPGQWMSIMASPEWKISEVFHFLVIDRADGRGKIFTATGSVYAKIREYATNPKWGDPRRYDLTVTRTEEPGKNYYSLMPDPDKTDLMKSDIEKVSHIDIPKLLPLAIPNSQTQPDELLPGTMRERLPWESKPLPRPEDNSMLHINDEPAPTAEPEDAPVNPDIVHPVDPGDEPINLDDIPF